MCKVETVKMNEQEMKEVLETLRQAEESVAKYNAEKAKKKLYRTKANRKAQQLLKLLKKQARLEKELDETCDSFSNEFKYDCLDAEKVTEYYHTKGGRY